MKMVSLTECEYNLMMEILAFAMHKAKPKKALEIQNLRAEIIENTEVIE